MARKDRKHRRHRGPTAPGRRVGKGGAGGWGHDIPVPEAPEPAIPGHVFGHMERSLWIWQRMGEQGLLPAEDLATGSLRMHEYQGGPLPFDAKPLDMAQMLIYDAWETEGGLPAVRLAERALALCPDCADAYLIFAEEVAATQAEARRYLEKGLAAGERALKQEPVEIPVGDYESVVTTRPYVRVRAALAHLLWNAGDREGAIAHAHEIIRLSDLDKLGMRYSLLSWLLEEGRDGEAEELVKRGQEESAMWMYSQTLIAFRREGKSEQARSLLARARAFNPYVPDYLLGNQPLPPFAPETFEPRAPSEAESYAFEWRPLWCTTPGALEWLKDEISKPPKGSPDHLTLPEG